MPHRRRSPGGPNSTTRPRTPAVVLRVRSGSKGGYRVFIGPGMLARLVRDLARPSSEDRARHRGTRSSGRHVVVVSDHRVTAYYGRRLLSDLRRAGARADLLTFQAGEARKTRETKSRLEDRLAERGFGGDGTIVALGGGVTGDLAGFLAATWHRGVPVVQAPTSLIAMIDSAIGGKVAVDHPLAKNLVGAYHPPLAVYADIETLGTLPPREFHSGLAEAVKCGAIVSASLFRRIERDASALARREPGAVLRLVKGAAAVKARIVCLDEREAGLRRLLNFGHTIGHALEAVSGYRMRHGEAVSVGMMVEMAIATRIGVLHTSVAGRVAALLGDLGLPVRIPQGLDPDRILDAMRRDKKVRRGELRFALPERLGRHAGGAGYTVPVPEKLVRRLLRHGDVSL